MTPGQLRAVLDESRQRHGVVGASAAVLSDGQTSEASSGVLSVRTGQETRPDALFQAGSVTKVWTAALVLELVDEGQLSLDEPVGERLGLAAGHVAAAATPRQLLSHTSGLDGDLFLDTGRGDDALARYVDAMAGLEVVAAPGTAFSYCNAGYSLLGHLVATVTGTTWETALQERLLGPLDLDAAGALPEQALLHAAAVGHLTGPDGPVVAPQWAPFRSAGPAGLLHCRARDLLALVDVVRAPEAVADVPDRWSFCDQWGLGPMLGTWAGEPVWGHDGATIGQAAFLRVLPRAGVAVSLMTNGGRAPKQLFADLLGAVLAEVPGCAGPPTLVPRPDLVLDLDAFAGTFSRSSVDLRVEGRDGGAVLVSTPTGPLATLVPPQELRLLATDVPGVAIAEQPTGPTPVVAVDVGGRRCLHMSGRLVPPVPTA